MKIHINKLRIRAFHGVLPLESIVGQDFEVSVTLNVDYDGTDAIDSTVNYAEVCSVITEAMKTPSALIEHAAVSLTLALRAAFPAVRGGSLTLIKLAPPMPFELESVAVSLDF